MLILTDTKIDGSFHSAELSVENYALYHNDPNAHGWGIMTYIKSYLPHRCNPEIESNRNDMENIVFEIQLHEKGNIFSFMI